MTYQLCYPWRKNPRLVAAAFVDAVGIDDVEIALAEVVALMDEAQAPLHVLLDFSQAVSVPQELVKYLPHAPMVGHAHCGYCVFVSPNEFVSFAAKIFNHQTQMPIELTPDENDAWEFFNQMGIC